MTNKALGRAPIPTTAPPKRGLRLSGLARHTRAAAFAADGGRGALAGGGTRGVYFDLSKITRIAIQIKSIDARYKCSIVLLGINWTSQYLACANFNCLISMSHSYSNIPGFFNNDRGQNNRISPSTGYFQITTVR